MSDEENDYTDEEELEDITPSDEEQEETAELLKEQLGDAINAVQVEDGGVAPLAVHEPEDAILVEDVQPESAEESAVDEYPVEEPVSDDCPADEMSADAGLASNDCPADDSIETSASDDGYVPDDAPAEATEEPAAEAGATPVEAAEADPAAGDETSVIGAAAAAAVFGGVAPEAEEPKPAPFVEPAHFIDLTDDEREKFRELAADDPDLFQRVVENDLQLMELRAEIARKSYERNIQGARGTVKIPDYATNPVPASVQRRADRQHKIAPPPPEKVHRNIQNVISEHKRRKQKKHQIEP